MSDKETLDGLSKHDRHLLRAAAQAARAGLSDKFV